jgi:hypothetical protein
MGMAIHCAIADRSVGVKVRWFFLFFITWPIGSLVYFFTVYRAHIKSINAEGAGLGSAHP